MAALIAKDRKSIGYPDRHQENFPPTFSWGEESSSLGATFPGSKQRSERKVWMFQLWPPEDQQGNFDSGAWLKAKNPGLLKGNCIV